MERFEELFRQSVGGSVARGDPIEQVAAMGHIERTAVGHVRGGVVEVRLSVDKDFGEKELYLITVDAGGSQLSRRYDYRFDGDAVFEKLVREYDLVEDPDEADYENAQEAAEEYEPLDTRPILSGSSDSMELADAIADQLDRQNTNAR